MARRKNPVLPGYKYLGGSSRRYINPSGESISRRQYEDIRLQKFGWDNWTDYQKTKRRDDEWIRDQGIYTRKQDIKKTEIGPTSEFSEKFLKMRTARRKAKTKKQIQQYHASDGAFAEYLVFVGLRQDDWEWDVGDTPTK